MKKIFLFVTIAVIFLVLPNIMFGDTMSLSELVAYTGEADDDNAGDGVSNVGDVDNDGYDDFIISAGNESTSGPYNGAVYLFYGSSSLLSSSDLSGANAKFTGETAGSQGSIAVSAGGDVNNDGYNDFLIGSNGENDYTGAAYLIYGKSERYSGTTNLGAIDTNGAKFTSENDHDLVGYSVSSIGDINNDSYGDFIIGATSVDSGNGAAYLVYGKSEKYSGSTILESIGADGAKFSGNDESGRPASAAGDVNNDGYDDFLVGVPRDNSLTGAAYLIYGKAAKYSGTTALSALGDDGAKFTGEAVDDYAAYSLATAGDVDADGYADFIIGAFGNNVETGAAYLIYGKAAKYSGTTALASLGVDGAKFTGEAENDRAGVSVSSAGDVNNDGFLDILIGASKKDTYTGKTYLIYGQVTKFTNASLSTANQMFTGEATTNQSGTVLSSAGDVNGDNFDDVIIGAPGVNSAEGKAYLGYLYVDVDGDGLAGTGGLLDGTDTNDNDHDNDNSETGTDCNDDDATISANQTYYQDSDGDGLGNALVTTSVCSLTAPAGYVTNSTDTNDAIKDISTITAGDNGDITITYVNNDISTIDVFDYTGTDDVTLKQYQDNYYLALHPKAKKLALIDINALTVLSRKTLSKKSFPTNSLKTYTLRNKPWAVITAKNKNNKVKLSLVKIVITQEKLGKKVSASLVNKKITPSKTKKNKNTILLRSKKNKIITKYLLTKKLILKEI
ncbi:MAG: integrin alpha [Patescibacteria group bacterium]|jgi:hypothetical protein